MHLQTTDPPREGLISWLGRFNRLDIRFSTFDFSGCGESDHEARTIAKLVDDLCAAIQFAKSVGCNRIAFFGYSLGSLICLKGYTPEVATMILTGVLTDRQTLDWSQFYSQKQLEEFERNGFTTIKSFGESRKDVKQFFYGNGDSEKKRLMIASQKAMKYLLSESTLTVIADHRIFGQIPQVAQLSKDWFLKYC